MNDRYSDRIRSANDKPVNEDGEFIIYWMIATRRFNYNSSLEFAAQLAVEPVSYTHLTLPTNREV